MARDRRYIFGDIADRLVPPDQVCDLWEHWEKPRISWCTGGHVSALLQREPRALVDEAVAMSFGPGAVSLDAASALELQRGAAFARCQRACC